MPEHPSRKQQLETLYLDHHRWLLAWLRRRLGDGQGAADLMHDTFVKVMGKPGRLDEIREPRAWLTTISRCLLIDHLRRSELERAYAESVAQLPGDEAPSPEAQVMMMSVLLRIDALLAELPPRVRAAFLLSRLEGLPYAEIACRLGVSLPSVEKYMAIAIRHCYQMRLKLTHEELLPAAPASLQGGPAL
ncbi:sigma-70 family RNA polymerase sigma factor [Thauera linaloolentis]|uniref:ECF subfamily RNA polymerase sigma-24 factor n=1 Tax=Thauera linaloolentis (strain DSM 12138 / JCM 21573 / CCUG 41526 / CIP 105981 / IAM 15112 / NBRC 102519 / 47Lol) TaxID=1123367 RepID=N6Z5C4_THAL4|nr:sigma-70 family RNA polymerase sigma factor [Thauera linaloolentis]ENO89628.1 ECF subfamily RNA polymerase sigma-24 factor [Thauera linaloolentis 47Lol = DSM 12138]MCM8565946.1 sigma-70 family RNA polymerase sigma factor [Thauera linaloolentis]